MLKKLLAGLMGGNIEVPGNPLTLEQGRKAARRPCNIDVEGWAGRNHFQGQVVNMSASGLCLQLTDPVKVKANGTVTVTIEDPPRGVEDFTVDCLVKWARFRQADQNQFIGLEYKDPKKMGKSWIKVKMQDLGFRPYNLKEQRKELRIDCSLRSTVSIAGTSVSAEIKNIGLGGVFVELPKPLRAGAPVDLRVLENPHIPAGTYTGTVRHQQHPDPSAPFSHGLAFSGLSAEQSEAIRAFVIETLTASWEGSAGPTLVYDPSKDAAIMEADLSDVEIPDLQDIMDETEPEEEEESEESGEQE